MFQVFVDRKLELAVLEEEYKRDRASFAIIYGRRRVGKTELIRKFIEGKKGVYYLADERGYERNLREFQKVVERELEITDFSLIQYGSWVDVLKRVAEMFQDTRIVLAVDEFPYLVEKGVLSEFQKAWDLYLSNTKIFLILIGSSVSMMTRLTLDYSSPLYGRRTMQLKVEKMKFWDAWKLMPSYTYMDFLKIYAAVDGIPHYLVQMDQNKGAEENIKEMLLRKDRVLYEEAEILLRMEFREFQRYFSILHAISNGKRRFSEIADITGMDSGTLSKYLSVLQECGLVKEEKPLFGKKKMRRYKLADNYFTFWFRFVYSNKNPLEIGKIDVVWNQIKEDFYTYLGRVYEEIIFDLYSFLYPERVCGQWWNREGEEIDILAIDEKNKLAVCGEVKLGKINRQDLEKLKEKASRIQELKEFEKKYLLVGKEVEVKESKNVEIWTLKEVEKRILEL
ncbi:MAG: ATP-binding protein [Thermoplasmata archaeon]